MARSQEAHSSSCGLISAVLWLMLAAPAAAQAPASKVLFPPTLAGLELQRASEAAHPGEAPLYEGPVEGAVPAAWYTAEYLNDSGARIEAVFLVASSQMGSVLEDTDAALLSMVSLPSLFLGADAAMERTQHRGRTVYQLEFENMGGDAERCQRTIAVPVAGHAVLRLTSEPPHMRSTDDLLAAFGEFDLAALERAAAAHAGHGAHLWAMLAALPASVEGITRTFIEVRAGGGQEPGLAVIAHYGGDRYYPESWELTLLASVIGTGEGTVLEAMGLADEIEAGHEPLHGRTAGFLPGGEPGYVVAEGGAMLMLSAPDGDQGSEALRGMLAALDVEPFFQAAAAYLADADRAASRAGTQQR